MVHPLVLKRLKIVYFLPQEARFTAFKIVFLIENLYCEKSTFIFPSHKVSWLSHRPWEALRLLLKPWLFSSNSTFVVLWTVKDEIPHFAKLLINMMLLFNTLPGNASPFYRQNVQRSIRWAHPYVYQQNSYKKNFVLIVCKPYVCFRLAMCFSHSSTPTCVCLATMPGIPIFPPAQCLAILLSMCFFTDDRQRLKAEKCLCPDSKICRGMSENVKLEQKA